MVLFYECDIYLFYHLHITYVYLHYIQFATHPKEILTLRTHGQQGRFILDLIMTLKYLKKKKKFRI